ISGILAAAGFILIISQAPVLFDGPVRWTAPAQALDALIWGALGLAAIAFAATILLRRYAPRLPADLIAVVFGALAFAALHWIDPDLNLGPLVPAPSGEDAIARFVIDWSLLRWSDIAQSGDVIVTSILAIGFLNTLLTTRRIVRVDEAERRRSDLDGEIARHGVANMMAGGVTGISCSGQPEFTRDAPAQGDRRLVAIGAAATALALATLGAPLLALLPQAVLAGLIAAIALRQFDDFALHTMAAPIRRIGRALGFAGGGRMQGVGVPEIAMVWCVIAAGLAFNLNTAVGGGVVLAMIAFIARVGDHVVRRETDGVVRRSNAQRSPEENAVLDQQGARIRFMELESYVFFGSAERLVAVVEDHVADGVDFVILDFRRVKDCDRTGVNSLAVLADRLADRSVRVLFAGAEHLSTLTETIGIERRLRHAEEALSLCEEQILAAYDVAPDDIIPLQRGALTAGLDIPDNAYIEAKLTYRTLDAGETLFAEGENGDSLFYVVSGAVDLFLESEAADLFRIRAHRAGAVFGEMALLDAQPRSATARCSEDAELLELTRAHLADIERERPELAARLHANLALMLAARLRDTNKQLQALV
ncbi:MAG: cyclic nucleotide-binding domain-containing protein, partial [Pseudomonadota bacterium]